MTTKLEKEDRDAIFETIKEVPIPLIGLFGMIETVSSVPSLSINGNNAISGFHPTQFSEQFKLYVNSFTSPSAAAWYFYSNRAHRWISSTGGLIG